MEDCSTLLGDIYKYWCKSRADQNTYKVVNLDSIGKEMVSTKRYLCRWSLLGFLEGVISNLLRYHRNKKGEMDEVHVTRWDIASEDSFIELEDSVVQQSRALKSYGDESTRGPSNSNFTNYIDKDPSRFIEVEIDKNSFHPTNSKMLDLKKVKTENYKILKDEKVLNQKIKQGMLKAEQEIAENNLKSIENAAVQSNHIYV
jgi:hypothetical protein